ncbi:substrate-binding domain-containing protein [Chitinibacter bivalviorum]|uniref:Substrate-binding domain-containing protein n=1 Tax=Chitinibacter bivalviorum TaxID=2739434 RepID=A0A7H9BR85_9NEIS|nr:substrate-binding domain-containing protein [Chitinibacter bivalviorum]QLG89744.1 substrate-binding domain-containing protein [Chitinibacter bivalviorum]
MRILLGLVWSGIASVLLALPTLAADWPVRVGVSVSSVENPYFVALTRGAQEKIKQFNPAAKMMVRSSDYSVETQIKQINELLEQKIDLLIIAASHEHRFAAVLEKAKKQGVIVIGVDVRADGASQTVLTNNLQAGQLVCDYLARSINGKGRVLIQTGPQVSSVLDRVAGCKAAWAHYPGIQLLSDKENGDGSVWGGHTAMQNALSAYGPVDAVFTINDRQALGTMQALQKGGFSQTKIGSVDGSQAVVKAIAAGSQIIVSASQSPESMGQKGVELGVALHAGGKSDPELVLLNTTLVTKDNAATFKAWDASRPNQ